VPRAARTITIMIIACMVFKGIHQRFLEVDAANTWSF